jgi:hypothetical protein
MKHMQQIDALYIWQKRKGFGGETQKYLKN